MYKHIIILMIYLIAYPIQAQDSAFLVGFTPSNCDANEEVSRLKRRIVDQWYNNDTLIVEIASKATCCVDFQPSIRYDNQILELNFIETGDFCECICCYQFIYKIIGLKGQEFTIHLNDKPIQQSDDKYLTYPVRFDIYKGDTVNYFDKYGQRQGVFLSTSKPMLKMIYKNNKRFNGVDRELFYDNGNKRVTVEYREGVEYYITYFRNNKVREECIGFDILKFGFESIVICNSFDSLGNQIREMNCYPYDGMSNNSVVVILFKSSPNIFYIKTAQEEYLKKIDSLDKLSINKGSHVLLCYEKSVDIIEVEKAETYLYMQDVLNVELNEFEKKDSFYESLEN